MAASRYDTSGQTQVVRGLLVGAGTGKDWIEPPNDWHDVDPRPHGFVLQFVNRTGVPTGTISSDDFAVSESDDAPLFDTTRNGGTDLPIRLTLQFVDVDADQQPNSAMSPPLFLRDARGEQTIDAGNCAMEVGEAAQIAARMHRRMAFDAKPIGTALTAQQRACRSSRG